MRRYEVTYKTLNHNNTPTITTRTLHVSGGAKILESGALQFNDVRGLTLYAYARDAWVSYEFKSEES